MPVETLLKNLPTIAVEASVAAATLGLAWRIFHRGIEMLEKLVERHETVEAKQFATIDRLARAVSQLIQREVITMASERDENWYGIPEPPELQKPVWEVDASMLRALQSDQRDWGHTPLELATLHGDPDCRGNGVTIAILDTGVDFSHPDLAPNRAATGHKDFTGSRIGFTDVQGHGTHCAGIAASAENGNGMVGAAPRAKIVSLKILNDNGRGLSTWTDAAIEEAGRLKIDIISGSLGGPKWGEDTTTRRALKAFLDLPHRPWAVFALGNSGPGQNTVGDPGWYPEILGVAASNRLNRIADFSSRDPNPSHVVACPGETIVSTLPGNRYGAMSGTSMATPYAAGCLAAIRGKLKALGLPIPHMNIVLEGIRATSADVPPQGPDTASGAGLLQPAKLLAWLVARAKPIPAPSPNPKPRHPVTVRSSELAAAGIASLVVTFLD